MKNLFLLTLLILSINGRCYSQATGSITVNGDFEKYYPVTWIDGNWPNSKPTLLSIGRSDVHLNDFWRGSLISEFSYHVTRWGHGSNFINAFISRRNDLIAGWADVTGNNGDNKIIIWLRGGGTTYIYNANADFAPVVYDGIQNSLPFNEENGPSHTYKTVPDAYVNQSGISNSLSAWFNGSDVNYFNGNVGIGTNDTRGFKLAVAGNVIAESVKVQLKETWPDYVFRKGYRILSLPDLDSYIKVNKHLPDIPQAAQAEKEGINLGEMNGMLLKKIEELTLYLIEQDKKNTVQDSLIKEMQTRNSKLLEIIGELSKQQ